jgi:hypothetical protein
MQAQFIGTKFDRATPDQMAALDAANTLMWDCHQTWLNTANAWGQPSRRSKEWRAYDAAYKAFFALLRELK